MNIFAPPFIHHQHYNSLVYEAAQPKTIVSLRTGKMEY